MATLEELVNQYATEIPDYLRTRKTGQVLGPAIMQQEPAFVPPATPLVLAPPKAEEIPAPPAPILAQQLQEEVKQKPVVEKQTRTRIETENVMPNIQALEKMRSETAAQLPVLGKAAQQAIEQEKQRILPGQKQPPSEFAFSPETLEAIQKEEQSLLAKLGKAPQMDSGGSTLEQALIAFVPALVGAGIGSLAGVPGGAFSGLGAGGEASAGAIKLLNEARKDKIKRETEAYLKDLDVSKEVFKERIKTLKEPELIKMKTVANFSAATLQPGATKAMQEALLKGLTQKQVATLPAVDEYQAILEKQKNIDQELLKLKAKGGAVKKVTEQETRVKPPEAATTKGEGAKVKGLTAAQTAQFTGFANAESQLLTLAKKVKENRDLFGIVKGPIAQANVFDPEKRNRAKVLASELGQLVYSIAKSAESGRLSDQDIKLFTQMGVSLNDNPQIAIQKIQTFLNRIRTEKQNTIKSLKASGVDVSGFEPMSVDRKARLEQLRAKQAQQQKK